VNDLGMSQRSLPDLHPKSPPRGLGRAGLTLLAASNFVVGSGAMCMTGLVGLIAQDLAVSTGAAAQLLTGYALSFALSAPLVALFAARVCRKTLLVWALACFGVLMLAAAAAPSFALLWLARALGGAAAAAFVPNASAVAAALAAPAERGRSLTVVFGGFTIALVLGSPLGTYVGVAFGWRVIFSALGLAALVMALLARSALPGGIMVPGASRAAFASVSRQGRLLSLLAINAIGAAGTFAVFSLAAVALPELLGTSSDAMHPSVAAALLVFGLGALAGNAFSLLALDRVGSVRMATLSFLLTALALGALASRTAGLASWAALAIWGVATFVGTTAMQTRLVAEGPALASALLPLNSSAQFAGQAIGTVCGAAWFAQYPGDVAGLAWIGFSFTVAAAAWSWARGGSSPGAATAAGRTTA